jgi:hypothetical protein
MFNTFQSSGHPDRQKKWASLSLCCITGFLAHSNGVGLDAAVDIIIHHTCGLHLVCSSVRSTFPAIDMITTVAAQC